MPHYHYFTCHSLRTATDNMNFISAAQRFVGKTLEIFGIIGNNPHGNPRPIFSLSTFVIAASEQVGEQVFFSELGLKADSGLMLIFGSDMLPVMSILAAKTVSSYRPQQTSITAVCR